MNLAIESTPKVSQEPEYKFSDADFHMIAARVNAKYGLFLQDSKRALVYSRLAKRLSALGLDSFKAYCELLETPAGESEQSHLLTALTTNVTHFFREKHHFDQLRCDVLPNLTKRAQEGESIRIWSAACSAGQEAYCLAAIVLDVCPKAADYDIKILGTDIDPTVIEKAIEGTYPDAQEQAIPPEYKKRMLDMRSGTTRHISMRQELKSLISFKLLNLMDIWPMKRMFDVIMCRNAAIYFDKPTQAKLWSRFEKNLASGGYLMIGHSERLSGECLSSFENVGITAYRKK